MRTIAPPAVLVVDDDLEHLQITRLFLRAELPAADVMLCRTGAQALLALSHLPGGTLVLIDRLLDGVESFQTVVAIRERRPDLAVVMISAALSSVDRGYALACGARDAIEKPATLAAWRAALAQMGIAGPAVVSPRGRFAA